MKKLSSDFYNQNMIDVARNLLGKYLVVKKDGKYFISLIYEVEAYGGDDDDASHASKGKTDRNAVMFDSGGKTYVYQIYGMYYCLNVVCGFQNVPQAVLIRSVLPLNNLDRVAFNRYKKTFSSLSKSEKRNLANGPGKICKSFNINRKDNGINLLEDEIFILESTKKVDFEIISTPRINIDYAVKSKNYLYRFLFDISKFLKSLDRE